MSSISIKGIIIGALVDFAGSRVVGIVLVAVLAMSGGIDDSQNAASAFEAGKFRTAAVALSCLATVLAGYVAARVAKRGELINGTLCTFSSVALTIFGFGYDSDQRLVRDFIELAVIPLAGLLGGYLRLRQVRAALGGEPGQA